MPSTITKYKIFLASPSDLYNERISIEEVIDELNLTFGKQHDIHLELLKWETHSAPAIAISHPQEIINADIGHDYDLFIGLIWKKFGTPTNNANSGTEEEFLNAYNRFLETPNSLQVLFYFNTTPVSIDDINPEQLLKIKNFKNDIGKNKKVLYWEYQNFQQLSKFLRIHIPQRIMELRKFHQLNYNVNKQNEILNVEILNEEYGIIDYQEMIENNFQESTSSLSRITEATKWIGEQMDKKTSEMEAMNISGNQISRKALKNYFVRTAKVMDNYADRIKPEIPIFKDYFEKGIDAMSNLINISRDDLSLEKNEIEETEQSLSELIDGMAHSIKGMESFLQSVTSLPRISKELNKAKLNVSIKLEELLDNLKISLSIAVELRKSIKF